MLAVFGRRLGMVRKSVNRQRVADWRKRLRDKGYRSITVFLDTETMGMLKSLQGHFRARRNLAYIIATAVRDLHKRIGKRDKR